jgi:hypothetical protein
MGPEEATTTEELQYLMKEIGREMGDNLPKDLGFLVLVYHKSDGAVAWTGRVEGNEQMAKARQIVRDWLDRADRMISHA